ncbi:MAG TPA: outer membrane beta-barrel protein [Pirellulaceae bacterium]|nr:outer membrane beta-barrel protein [Pirellulaceae bacterium]
MRGESTNPILRQRRSGPLRSLRTLRASAPLERFRIVTALATVGVLLLLSPLAPIERCAADEPSRLDRILGAPSTPPATSTPAVAPDSLPFGSGGAFRSDSRPIVRDPLVRPASVETERDESSATGSPPATRPRLAAPLGPNSPPRTASRAASPLRSQAIPSPAERSLLFPADDPAGEMLEAIDPFAESPDETGDSGAMSPLLEPIPDPYADPHQDRHGRTVKVNPLVVQQGAANLTLGGDEPLPRESLGFPFSAIPDHWGRRIPRLQVEFDFPDSRHVGRGEPLQGTSWRNRPLHADLLIGAIFPGDPIATVASRNGMLEGLRVGWDLNHYLGGELRLAQADVGIDGRNDRIDIRLYDVTFAYYPWGDSRIRPFTSLGFGMGQWTFRDINSLAFEETVLTMPFGAGLKYYVRPNVALRAEVMDTFTFGSGAFEGMHAVSLTAGFEYRFGGARRNYFPYQASARVP